jgi:glycosyltransferase involved in cell wall biosynthesis
MKVSIVLPVYNAQNYLNNCMESLVKQTYKNLEFICINDGSTDNSLEIIEFFSYKDERVICINQKNMGQSTARNEGVKVSSGDFIFFIDADDFLSLNCIEKLVDCSSNNPNVIASTEVRKSDPDGNVILAGPTHELGCYSHKEVMKGLYSQTTSAVVWGKLFPSALVKNQYFISKLAVGEDLVYLVEFFTSNNFSLVNIEDAVYNYLVLPGSTSREISQNKVAADLEKISILKKNDINNEYSKELCIMTATSIFIMYSRLIKQGANARVVKEYSILMDMKLVEFDLRDGLLLFNWQVSSPYKYFLLGVLLSRSSYRAILLPTMKIFHSVYEFIKRTFNFFR